MLSVKNWSLTELPKHSLPANLLVTIPTLFICSHLHDYQHLDMGTSGVQELVQAQES